MKSGIKRSAIGLIATCGLTVTIAVVIGDPDSTRPYADYLDRSSVTLRGYHRQFESSHRDFQRPAVDGAGRYANTALDGLSDEGKPLFRGKGRRVEQFRRTADGHMIMFDRSYIDTRPGDMAGRLSVLEGGSVSSGSSFREWYRDVPGVNVGTSGSLSLARDPVKGTYVFDGALGAGGALGPAGLSTGSAYSTYEVATTFIHHADEQTWFDVVTDADVWVFIDGRLVIDGGGGAGRENVQGEPLTEFEIIDGKVIPGQPFAAEVQVLGAAIQTSEYHMPVTARIGIGEQDFEGFGSFDDPIGANLNDNQEVTGHANPGANPRSYVLPFRFNAGTPIVVDARSWDLGDGDGDSVGDWDVSQHESTRSPTQQIRVLRHGDPVPTLSGAYDQADAASFVADFIDFDTQTVHLAANQVIYLMELGTTDLDSPNADYQDLVAIVSLASDEGYFEPGGTNETSTPTETTAFVPAPLATQRIQLDRLSALKDGRTYDLKIFVADRDDGESPVRFETNIRTLNLATPPGRARHFD